jgi:hypothetical protein
MTLTFFSPLEGSDTVVCKESEGGQGRKRAATHAVALLHPCTSPLGANNVTTPSPPSSPTTFPAPGRDLSPNPNPTHKTRHPPHPSPSRAASRPKGRCRLHQGAPPRGAGQRGQRRQQAPRRLLTRRCAGGQCLVA